MNFPSSAAVTLACVLSRSKGIFAFGQVATGVIAIGQLSRGCIAVGQLAFGVISVGQLAFGVAAVGQFALGVFWTAGLGIGAFAGPGLVFGFFGRLTKPRLIAWLKRTPYDRIGFPAWRLAAGALGTLALAAGWAMAAVVLLPQ